LFSFLFVIMEEDHVKKGIELAEDGDIAAAKNEFKIAEQQDPKKADLYYKMGVPAKRPMVKRALSGKLLVLWVVAAVALAGAYMLDGGKTQVSGTKENIAGDGDAVTDSLGDGGKPRQKAHKGGGGDIQVRDADGGAAYQAEKGVIEGLTGLNPGLPIYVGIVIFLIVTFFILQDAYKLYLSNAKNK